MQLKSLIEKIEKKYPLSLAYDWDNSGLNIGDLNQEIKKVLLCLELNQEILKEAIEKKADLVITHHPLIFKGIKKFDFSIKRNDWIKNLIKNDISVYCMHTNFDIGEDGLNDYICDKLDLKNKRIIEKTSKENYYKCIIYIPFDKKEEFKEHMLIFNETKIGNYDACGFEMQGVGSFRPLEGSQAFVGEKNKIAFVKESRLEFFLKGKFVKKFLDEAKKIHPYEEMAYDLFEISDVYEEIGLGKFGELKKDNKMSDLIAKIKQILNIENVVFIGDLKKNIKTVGVITGSGADCIKLASNKGCDLFITGDVKYHQALEAEEMGINVLDVGHYGSENIFPKVFLKSLEKEFKEENIEFFETKINIDPFKLI